MGPIHLPSAVAEVEEAPPPPPEPSAVNGTAASAEDLMMNKLNKELLQRQSESEGIYRDGKLDVEETVRQLFAELDIDQNNSLQRSEVITLSKRLGIKYSESKFDKVMRKLDPDFTDEVTFEMFLAWAIRGEKRKKKK